MNAWDILCLTLTFLGLVATVVLAWEAWMDRLHAAPDLMPLARQVFRHEALRAIKQALLVCGIGIVFFRDVLEPLLIMNIRNAIIASVSIILTINSLFDLSFRFRYFRDLRGEERLRLRRMISSEKERKR